MKKAIVYLWKLPLCAAAFFVGTAVGGMAANGLGLPAPELPAGADQTIIGQYTLLTSLIMAAGLAVLS